MAAADLPKYGPISEQTLRDMSKDIVGILPDLTDQEPDVGVKTLHALIDPLLQTATAPDLGTSHRAAACNTLCAVIERAQKWDLPHIQDAILDDSIWSKSFTIYLEKSDSVKGKSVRQVLLTLTNVLLRNQNPRAFALQDQTVATFVDIICSRQDRVKVKAALQGLAHFLQKEITTIPKLVAAYSNVLQQNADSSAPEATVQSLFTTFLSWVVHHDTALSAGHLIKNFLIQYRKNPYSDASTSDGVASIWIKPVVECLHNWSDRIQEFKTHVFPHCFLPNVSEYVQFLSYLHFARHVESRSPIPPELNAKNTEVNQLEDFEEFRILLASIQTAKELGIVRDVDYRLCKTISVELDAIILPDDIFGGWLSHVEGEVRLAGLFLSVYSTNITRPITGGIFKSLRKNLLHLHNDTDVNFRRELIGYIQKLFNRLRGSTAILAKSIAKAKSSGTRLSFPEERHKQLNSSAPQEPLSESLHFIKWYLGFLDGEIRADASYQRRITALRALMVVYKSGVDPRVPHRLLSKGAQGQLLWAHGLQITNATLIRKLLDMTSDAFDDIRDTSIAILKICFETMADDKKEAMLSTLPPFIKRAESIMLRTGRADQADGLARSYALYYSCLPIDERANVIRSLTEQLQDTLVIAQNDLSEAVNGRPVHGIFAALRYIIDQDDFYPGIKDFNAETTTELKQMHSQLLKDFDTVWNCVKDTLTADAPEGHVPDELEEEVSLDTKEILSYSWRGLKEASTLLRVMAARAPIGSADSDFLTAARFEELGRLCFTQLIELRHRGAFSAVAQTFAAFCRRCYDSDDENLRGLPDKWYQETLLSIQAQAHAITRRSGGIPALMAGIVAAEPQPGGKLFAQAMKDLIAEATVEAESSNIEESRLPQVHALNCIKEFFMTSKLSVASEAHIAESLELAATMLRSNIWPIRNCGLMLFKALIERLLGSDEAQDWKEREMTRTSRFSYDNYPALVGMLNSLLNADGPLKESLDTPDSNSPMDLHGAEGVFPALQILRQAMPPEENRASFISSIMRLLSSAHWHMRDMAARTITALYRPHELSGGVKNLLDSFGDSSNAAHGKLLCIKYCVRKGLQNSSDPDFLKLFMLHLSASSAEWYTQSNCPYVKAAFLDLVNICGTSIIENAIDESIMSVWAALTAAIGIGPDKEFALSKRGADALFQTSLAEVFFIDRTIVRPDAMDMVLSEQHQGIDKALQMLAVEAPDTCAAALNTLHRITQLKYAQGPVHETAMILVQVYRLIPSTSDTEVLSLAQTVLADGLTLSRAIARDVLNLIPESSLLATLSQLESHCLTSAPSNAQSALQLLAFLLDTAYATYPSHRPDLLKLTGRYIHVLRRTVIDTNPFDARLSAVQSLLALSHMWSLSPKDKDTKHIVLALALVLHDLLADDDDEIRDYAAEATTALLNAQSPAQSMQTVPMLTSHRLARFLTTAFADSVALQKEGMRRLLGSAAGRTPCAVPFKAMLAAAREEDTTLFAAEKQNLYFDPTLDAVLWGRVLRCVAPSAKLRDGLAAWVADALKVLVSTAEAERDGALGWAGREEVFTLGMRVVAAAGVVSDHGEIRELLVRLLEVGRSREVHGGWLLGVEGVLVDGFVGLVRHVGTKVKGAMRTLEN